MADSSFPPPTPGEEIADRIEEWLTTVRHYPSERHIMQQAISVLRSYSPGRGVRSDHDDT